MPLTRQHLDTNILVRFFCGEPAPMAVKVKRLVEQADAGEVLLVVTPVILAETFFTLESFYKMERKVIAESLSAFLESRGIEAVESDILLKALALCHERGFHFADAYLASVAISANEPVASFDRDFDKHKGPQRLEPK
jgi:predicted nucleic acid-binding protein